MEAEDQADGAQERDFLVRYEDDPGYWRERPVVQRVFNDGGWIIYTPHGDLYLEDYDYGRRLWSEKGLGTIG